MLHRYLANLALAVIVLVGSRAGAADDSLRQRGEAELLALHQADRHAHFNHDVQALLAHIGPQLLEIRDGKFNRMTREDVRKRFADYFHNAEFSAWDDLEPPIVHVSPDGQLGWMCVRVRIIYTETDPRGNKLSNRSVMAWTSTYERQERNWIMNTVTSTSEVPSER